jgi:hypothetical protein
MHKRKRKLLLRDCDPSDSISLLALLASSTSSSCCSDRLHQWLPSSVLKRISAYRPVSVFLTVVTFVMLRADAGEHPPAPLHLLLANALSIQRLACLQYCPQSPIVLAAERGQGAWTNLPPLPWHVLSTNAFSIQTVVCFQSFSLLFMAKYLTICLMIKLFDHINIG